MANDQGKFSSGRSSIITNQSSPELLDLLTSSSDISLQNSTSSLSVNIYAEDLPSCSNTNSNAWKARDDNPEEMSTNSTDRQNLTERSSISDECTSFTSRTNTSTTETRLSTTDTAKTTDTESDSIRKTDTTSYSDNSDSAYTNSHSIFNETIDSNLTYTSETQQSAREDDEDDTDTDTTETDNMNTEKNNKNPSSTPNAKNDHSKGSSKSQNLNESSTQTPSTANLNVISNIQLSQSTLDIIFNHVLQDVNNKQPNSINLNSLSATLPNNGNEEYTKDEQKTEESGESKIINVQPVPSFYLNRKEEIVVTTEHSRVMKYMLSNVGTGSPYSKPAEIPQVIVPRYSALPRTSSMEVNTSSADSTDRESDTISLADSLEDGISPRVNQNILTREDNKSVKNDDLCVLLPDNSDGKKVKSANKSAVFFIPIENKQKEDFKPVSYHLPAKVKEKLSRRQFKREQKIRQTKSNYTSPRSDSNYISASDNGNQFSFTVNNNPEYVDVKSVPLLPEIVSQKSKRKSRGMLPSIQNIRKIKIDSKDNIKYTETEKIRDRFNKPIKRRSITKYEKLTPKNDNNRQSSWSSKSFHKIPEKLTPIYTSRNEYTCDSMPKEIYHKTQFGNANKRIEILDIMECVNNEQKHHSLPKGGKSKIPVLVNNRLPKIDKRTSNFSRPVYLDFDHEQSHDSKMDQLIANILIDTLNKYENFSAPNSAETKKNILKLSNERRPDDIPVQNNNSKYQQKFDVIPEELSLQSSVEENLNRSEKLSNNSSLIEAAANILTKHVLKNSNVQEKLLNSNNKSTSVKSSKDTSKTEELPKSDSTLSGNNLEDILTIPQGWITFYMLHKNQGSPDSTSDEGTKLTEKLKKQCENSNDLRREMYKEHLNEDFLNNLNMKSEKILESSEEMNTVKKEKSRRDTLDTILSSDAFSDNVNPPVITGNNEQYSKQHSFKNVNNSNNNNESTKTEFSSSEQCTTHGWSVTVSGMNSYGQPAPDVEMRLKFPAPKENSGCCQPNREENVRNNNSYSYDRPCQLVKRHNHQNTINSVGNVITADDSLRSERLPIINQSRRISQQIDPNLTNSVVPFGYEPRQTKTSTRRYALNRPRNFQPVHENVATENLLNLSTETGILRRFPEFLSVSGNGINPEQRSCIYTSPR